MALDFRFIGTGGAFDLAYGNSAGLLTLGGHKVLVDCGHTVYPRLRQLGLVDWPDYVLPTHLHDDHVGSLSTLLYHRYFFTPDRRLKVLYPDDKMRDLLLGYLSYAMQDARQYAEFVPLSNIAGAEYWDTHGLHIPGMQTYAFSFSEGKQQLVYSADLGDADFIFKKLKEQKLWPDLVLHDITFYEMATAHAYYKKVMQYMDEYRIIGYHHDASQNPSDNGIELAHNTPEVMWSEQTL